MADTEDDAPSPTGGLLHPALDPFVEAAPAGEAGNWADESAAIIQSHLNRQAIADAATAAANKFATGLDTFKSQLVGMAHDDPTTTAMALDLVPGTVSFIANSTGHEAADDHAAALTRHIQSEIARAGVQSYAIRNEDAARQALDRYGEHLTEDDHAVLGQFIDRMAVARAADERAQVIEENRKARIASNVLAHDWLGRLVDPAGTFAPPHNWVRDMMADPRIAPDAKSALWQAHANLETGNPVASDPVAVEGIVNRIADGAPPSPASVIGLAGDRLSIADAQHLSAASFPQPAAVREHFAQIADAMDTARGVLAAPENGIAGQQAYTRFVNWLLPAARNGAILDPASRDYVLANGRLDQFAPSPSEIVAASLPRGAPADRPSLADIFSGAHRKPQGSA